MNEATAVAKSSSYNDAVFDAMLIPEATVITAKGDGASIDLSSSTSRVFLLTLKITKIVEQESFELMIHGSPDGQTFAPKALVSTPQVFYPGETPVLLDLSGQPDVKFVRAHWEVNRWGRGSEEPMFEASARLRGVPPDVLKK